MTDPAPDSEVQSILPDAVENPIRWHRNAGRAGPGRITEPDDMTAAVPQRSARARQRKPSNGRGIGGRSARHTRQSSSRRSSARGRSGIKLRALHLGVEVTAAELLAGGWDDVLIATGVRPRTPEIPGIEHEKVISYPDALLGIRSIGDRVAVIGAGGIGVDVSEFLTHDSSPALDLAKLCGR